MILQEEEQHNTEDLSSNGEPQAPQGRQPAQPACPTGQPACLPAAPGGEGGSQEALQSFLDMVKEAGEDEPSYDWRVFTEREYRNLDTERNSGSTPLLLTRGVQTASLLPSPPQKSIIDWLTFTANESVDILKQFIDIVIPDCIFLENKHGTQGYKKVIDITLNGEQLGKIGYMGTSPKNMVVLTGNGTEKVKDWSQYSYWLSLLAESSISQIHLALDDFEGKFMSHDIVKNAYDNQKFKSNKSRVNPSIDIKGKTTGNGINKGRTWDIGKNTGAVKHFCGYEKGLEQFFQLFSKLPESQQEMLIPKFTLGDLNVSENVKLDTSIYKWYRGEVKFHNRGVKLPIEMILERDKFYAGAYPFCEEILPMVEKKIPERLPSNFEMSMEEMYVNCGNSYGSAIFTALSVAQNEGKDLRDECVNIVQKIIANHCKLNQKLIKQGGLNHVAAFDPRLLKAPQDE